MMKSSVKPDDTMLTKSRVKREFPSPSHKNINTVTVPKESPYYFISTYMYIRNDK